mgnify:CR=1 FL=1
MEQQKDSKGAIIGSIIILIILIVGAIYFGKKAADERDFNTPNEEVQAIDEMVVNDPNFIEIEQRSSTNVDDLEADWQNAEAEGSSSFDYESL